MQYIHLEGAIKDFWDFEATFFADIGIYKFTNFFIYLVKTDWPIQL